MAKFMPVDDQKAQILHEKLAQTIFKSPDDFVNFYNTDLINKKNKDVIAFVEEILSTYRDVRELGGDLIFVSKQEVHVGELLVGLSNWELLIKIKRELTRLLNDKVLTEDSTIHFPLKSGHFYSINSAGETTRLSQERLFSRPEDIIALFEKFSSFTNEGIAEEAKFLVLDFTRRDVSFIDQMRSLLP